jgi:CheY-like chemotaxis protein/tRNA A-37 threonylcarbamoyl transferase component Bud32
MKNVLVVDDNAIVRRHLKGLLERDGCLVCEAGDGRAAIDALDARSFDVMFLDLHMPSMDGTEVLKELGERKKTVPVVLITSSESSAEIVRAFKLGARDYLTKPFREPLVRRALEKVTGLDFTTIQRTRTDVALLDRDEGLAQSLRTLATDGEVHHVETTPEVPDCVRRPHQLIFIGELEAHDGASGDEAEAEALADIAVQNDPAALLVRLLPKGQVLPDVTVFHTAVSRDEEAALKRVWKAVRSGGVMAAGRQVRALRYDGAPELEHAYWWTLRHSLETAFLTLLAKGSNVTLDLSLAPENQAQLSAIVDWALEFAERRMIELAIVREPVAAMRPPAVAVAVATPAPSSRAQNEVPFSESQSTKVLAPPTPAPASRAGPIEESPATDPTAPIDIPGFEVGALLGEGGMSRVYRATQKSLKRPVCIKVMRDEVAADPTLAERFRDEGVALATLRHPNIVSVLDVGKSRDGQLYMVMEYVDGCDLRALAARDERLTIGRTVELIGQLLSGLSEAHAHGIIHRDLKPSNVLVTTLKDESLLVKLVDFGIAKLLEGMSRSGQTRHGTVIGTPGYMAPEQLLGMDVSCATDLYAVGVLLFELVAGRRPFVARDEFELAQATMMAPVPHARELMGAGVPEALDALIVSLLAKNPKARPQTANEVRSALLAVPVPVAA